jgi:hypothetical protein
VTAISASALTAAAGVPPTAHRSKIHEGNPYTVKYPEIPSFWLSMNPVFFTAISIEAILWPPWKVF